MYSGTGSSKCLILGGYVVLNCNKALVISLSPKVTTTSSFLVQNFEHFTIFGNTLPIRHEYCFTSKDWNEIRNLETKFERFILSSFHVFFKYCNSTFSNLNQMIRNKGIEMNIHGDPQFYTEKGKTGLGSSSATTISIFRSLFKLFSENHIISPVEDESTLIFKLASIAHNLAQGNLGSGFDLSCSLWGSQVYRRPNKHLISFDHLNEMWDNEHIPFILPNNIRCYLLMTPFHGSSTPSLVRLFNQKALEDVELYNKLEKTVNDAIEIMINIERSFDQIRPIFQTIRDIYREITSKWGCELLPPSVDEIAEKVENLDGVIATVIPGAGGYDSIAALVHADVQVDFTSIGLNVIASS